jgi:hypothetical protein
MSTVVVPGAFSPLTSRFVDKYEYKIIKIVPMGQNGRKFLKELLHPSCEKR